MAFVDRVEAGQRVAEQLKGCDATLVVALPRGGVVVGYEIATALSLPLEVICPRKIGAPHNPEYAIGAITESGEMSVDPSLVEALGYSKEEINRIIADERAEAQRRAALYRSGRLPHPIRGERVILVDDGIATGSTMRAAIASVKQQGAASITLAVPVAPPETLRALKQEVDRIVCLDQPASFFAVGQFYHQFNQTSDDEVIALLQRCADGPSGKTH